MPSTPNGIVYPASSDNVQLWTHFQNMANSLETLVAAMLNPPRAKIKATSAVSVPNNAVTSISADTTDFDSDTMADLANAQLVVHTAGIYMVSAQIAWTANATGYRGALLYGGNPLGPSIFASQYAISTGAATVTTVQVVGVLQCAVGDVLQLRGIQTSGSALNATNTNASLWIEAHRIGP